MKKKAFELLLLIVLACTMGCGSDLSDENKDISSKKEDSYYNDPTGVRKHLEEYYEDGMVDFEHAFSVSFVNNTGADIYRLYASKAGSEEWEEDIMDALGYEVALPDQGAIMAWFTYDVDAMEWDFGAEDENGDVIEYYDIDFGKYGGNAVSIMLNEDGTVDFID